MTSQPNSFADDRELIFLDYPEVRNRCIKLKWRSQVESVLFIIGILLIFVTLVLLQMGYLGSTSRHTHGYTPPNPALIPYGYTALGLSLALFASAFAIQNYCLVDPVTHTLYRHFQFLLWRKRRIAFRPGEVLAVTSEGQKRSSKYSTYWVYRTIVIGNDGRRMALSSWRRDDLTACNARACEVAGHLECKSVDAPEESKVLVETEYGKPTIKFEDVSIWSVGGWRLTIFVIAIVLFVVIFAMMHR